MSVLEILRKTNNKVLIWSTRLFEEYVFVLQNLITTRCGTSIYASGIEGKDRGWTEESSNSLYKSQNYPSRPFEVHSTVFKLIKGLQQRIFFFLIDLIEARRVF